MSRVGPETHLAGMYGVRKSTLPDVQELLLWRKECVVTALSKVKKPEESPQFPVYTETEAMIWLPRYYGLQRLGLPTRDHSTLGVPMQSSARCVTVLDEKRQQIEAARCIRRAWADPLQRGGLICLPTAGGKTVVAIDACMETVRELHQGQAFRTMIIVSSQPLMKQWIERLKQHAPGARVGYLQQSHNDLQNEKDPPDVVVAMVHSLARHGYPGLETIGVVIFDEAHHVAAPLFSRALPRLSARYVLGLTATPSRNDGLTHVLHWFLGEILFQPPRPMEPVHVTMIWYDRKETPPEIKNKRTGQLLVTNMLKRLARDPGRNHLILEQIQQWYQDPGRRIIVFSSLTEHLSTLGEICEEAGIPHKDIGYLVGESSVLKRSKNITEKRVVLATIQSSAEGVDLPGLNTLIMALPVGNMIQISGRILRQVSSETVPMIVHICDQYSLFEKIAWKQYQLYKSHERFGWHVRMFHHSEDNNHADDNKNIK